MFISNTLDLIFTNEEHMITDLKVEAGLGKSDHMCLVMELSLSSGVTKTKSRRNFRKTNNDLLKRELQKFDWADLETKNVNETWTTIKERVEKAIEISTPMIHPSGKKRKPYIDKETQEIVRTKHRLFRKWQRSRLPEDEINYNKANNKARKECRKSQIRHEKTIAKEAKKNPKLFYSYANSKIKSRTGVADLTKTDGSKTSNDKEKAELLNNFFPKCVHN